MLVEQPLAKLDPFMDPVRAKCVLDAITPRQRSVLDLILEHRTSKEIARELDIAPNTVDQRLNAARTKLNARDRAETARIYAHLLSVCGESTYGSSVVDSWSLPPLSKSQEAELSPVFMLNDVAGLHSGALHLEQWEDLSLNRDLGARGLENKFWRMGIIVAIAAGVAVVVATVLSIMNALNALL